VRAVPVLVSPVLAVLLVVLGLSAGPTTADDLLGPPLVDARTREAIDAGLRFLQRTQNPDGSWTSNAGKKINEGYAPFEGGVDVPHVGITSLAVLAFLAGGHVPGRGPYGATLDRAVDFVLASVNPEGFIGAHRTRMYSHAFGVLALAEVYGLTRKERLRARLQDAVEYTVKCQNETGGWRYVPFTKDSDMSVTVCQVVALRAARNAGIRVPRATIDRALHYVIESANTGDNRYPVGSFTYQPQSQEFNRDSFALSAAGLATLLQAGLYDDESIRAYATARHVDKRPLPRIADILEYMAQKYREVRREYADHYFFYYGVYYAAQAIYTLGARQPVLWTSWYRQVRDDLLARQRRGAARGGGGEEGWWVSNVDTSHAYATASALLILQFPLDQLPIHQR